MKTELTKQGEPKSILDMTPFELSQIDQYQAANRGFRDEEDYGIELENWED